MRRRIVILGAAGRDFHNFNMRFRESPQDHVVAFTATQIPDIAGRVYPRELAGPLYPDGIPIVPEERLETLIANEQVDTVVLSYSDLAHTQVMSLASRVLAAGADFLLLGAESTMLKSRLPVVSVCAVRTGCGKSPVSRRIAELLHNAGLRVAVVRHPMPYGDLLRQRAQRFATLADLDRYDCTIEEREEYEPHLEKGAVVYAGVDYVEILAQAEREADVILWDGGNNDTPFFLPDLEIVVADPLRPGHELLYHPGEVNLLRADVVLINKVDAASESAVETVRQNIHLRNPQARIIEAASEVYVGEGPNLVGKRVLVIEDGPTLTHGGMSFGAGMVAARKHCVAGTVDPRPHAEGSIAEVFQHHPHIGEVLPAMGYSAHQLAELEATIARVPCDLVVIATPVDLARVIHIPVPSVRVHYEIVERSDLTLHQVVEEFVRRHCAVCV